MLNFHIRNYNNFRLLDLMGKNFSKDLLSNSKIISNRGKIDDETKQV